MSLFFTSVGLILKYDSSILIYVFIVSPPPTPNPVSSSHDEFQFNFLWLQYTQDSSDKIITLGYFIKYF